METLEGNKIIAEFMGYKLSVNDTFKPDGANGHWCFRDGEGRNLGIWEAAPLHAVNELKYHSSWGWLMPVVEKIGSLSYNDSNNKFQPTVDRFLENDIDSIWRQVVIFITWYNQEKK